MTRAKKSGERPRHLKQTDEIGYSKLNPKIKNRKTIWEKADNDHY